MTFIKYRRKATAELRPYVPGESMEGISVSQADRLHGSPKTGDMVARNSDDHSDMWLVSAKYFADNFEPVRDPNIVYPGKDPDFIFPEEQE